MTEPTAQLSEPEFSSVSASVMTHALDTFGTREKALSWMTTPNPVLDNQAPFLSAQTVEGANWVEQILTRIDYGIFS